MFLIKQATKSSSLTRTFFNSSKRLTPSQMYYTKNHEWVQFVDESKSLAKVGISDYAADKLGDLTYTSLEEIEIEDGEVIEAGEDLVDVESVKGLCAQPFLSTAADTVKMPVSGIVKKINETLIENSTIINRDAEDEGWLCQIEVQDMSEIDELMSKEAYKEYLESSEE